MKAFVLAAAIAGLAIGTAQAGTSELSHQVCLWSYNVDHTHVVSPTQVLFYMKNGKVWANNLPTACNGLKLHGFTMTGYNEEFCGSQPISILETHEACALGTFSPAPDMHASR